MVSQTDSLGVAKGKTLTSLAGNVKGATRQGVMWKVQAAPGRIISQTNNKRCFSDPLISDA